MEARLEKLLKAIVELHVKTAHPIGSKVLVEDKIFNVSPATIRNAMLELEQDGYIYQPYTSAGRIPTAKGYQYYLDHLLSVENSSDTEFTELKKAYDQDIRDLAKLLSAKTNLASLVALAPSDFYFTGLFNLFSQPEFADYKMVLSVTQVVDSLEKALAKIYHEINEAQVLIGSRNPFHEHCAMVITPLPTKGRELLAILGPARMDYNKVLGLLATTVKVIK